MEHHSMNGGDPNETTAVTKPPERPSNNMNSKIIFGLGIGISMLCLALAAITCGQSTRNQSADTVKAQTAMTSANVATLQARMVLVEGRTGVLEANADILKKDVLMDRISAADLALLVKGLQTDKVDKKDLEKDLKKYVRTRRIVKVERKLDDHITAVEERVAEPTHKLILRHTPTYVDVYRTRTRTP